MRKMILLFSHILNQQQIDDAKNSLHVSEFISMPQDLQKIWSNLDADLETIATSLEPIKIFLQKNSNKGDVVLIQGDFGASYMMVSFAKELRLTPVYATTKRTISEIIENEKTVKKSVFEHRRFREYE
jgi:hypothetical protein